MKKSKKFLSGAMSAAMLAGPVLVQTAEAEGFEAVQETVRYDEVSNVQGSFSFDQNVISPADTIFSLFGTAATGVCAKPDFAMDDPAAEENYYVNVSGRLQKSYAVSLSQLKKQGGVSKTMVCSCSTGPAIGQTSVTGVPVSEMLELSGVMEDANAVAFKSADGYRSVLPLSYALEKEAMLVWQIADESNPSGLQVWMPSTAAQYFTRQVTEIEVLSEENVPEVKGPSAEQRAKVSFMNRMSDTVHIGETVEFSGYADDCGTAIRAVEFSMDNGKTWTSCSTEGADADRWVVWNFAYVPKQNGTYKLDVRAVTEDGTVSPLASSVVFTVAGPVSEKI